jgi:hypothetical protein
MALRELQDRRRQDLLWYFLGFALMQLALGVGVDRFWPTIRDPDYDDIERIVREQQAAAPGRPLVIVLGSSRTQLALRAESLNGLPDAAGSLVLNAAVAGGGPMTHQIILSRLLQAGHRPQQVFVEIIPAGLSARDGAPLEERYLNAARLTAIEMVHLYRNCAQPYRMVYPWVRARALPAMRHQTELRQALAIDLPVQGRQKYHGRDAFGWIAYSRTWLAPEQVERLTRETVADHASALAQPALSPGAVRALREVLNLCRQEHIGVALFVPPAHSAFRNYAPAVAQVHLSAVRSLALELGVPLIDGHTWVDDDGFYDGHHAFADGADQFTRRFRHEALVPMLAAWKTTMLNAGR